MNAIASERRRFGYRKIGILLRREGIVVNHKRVYRVYREEGLAVLRRRKRHVRVARGNTPPPVTRPNERWSVDFIADTFASGRAMRVMTMVDDCTHEGLAVEPAFSFPSLAVVRVLEAVALQRGCLPRILKFDNGPEFTSVDAAAWAKTRPVARRSRPAIAGAPSTCQPNRKELLKMSGPDAAVSVRRPE
jgi:putative transposase